MVKNNRLQLFTILGRNEWMCMNGTIQSKKTDTAPVRSIRRVARVAIHERKSYRSRIAVVNLLYDRRRRHDTLYSRNTSYRSEFVRLSYIEHH